MFLLFTWNSPVLWLLFFCLVVCCWVGGFFHPFSAGWESCLSSFHCVQYYVNATKGEEGWGLATSTCYYFCTWKKIRKGSNLLYFTRVENMFVFMFSFKFTATTYFKLHLKTRLCICRIPEVSQLSMCLFSSEVYFSLP